MDTSRDEVDDFWNSAPWTGVCLQPGAALTDLGPDVIAVEGPADAQEAVGLAGHADLKPPVAMLVYLPDEPAHALGITRWPNSRRNGNAMQYGSQQGIRGLSYRFAIIGAVPRTGPAGQGRRRDGRSRGRKVRRLQPPRSPPRGHGTRRRS